MIVVEEDHVSSQEIAIYEKGIIEKIRTIKCYYAHTECFGPYIDLIIYVITQEYYNNKNELITKKKVKMKLGRNYFEDYTIQLSRQELIVCAIHEVLSYTKAVYLEVNCFTNPYEIEIKNTNNIKSTIKKKVANIAIELL